MPTLRTTSFATATLALAFLFIPFLTVNAQESVSVDVVTSDPLLVSDTYATFAGQINTKGVNRPYWFEYGTSISSMTNRTATEYISSTSLYPVFTSRYGLTPNTTYYYRLVSESIVCDLPGLLTCLTQTTYGLPKSFTTNSGSVEPPQVYECSDGLDNDSDGLIDSADPGCSSSTDDNEYNAPVPSNGEIVIDLVISYTSPDFSVGIDDFGLFVNGSPVTDEQSMIVEPGTYSVSVNSPTGFAVTSFSGACSSNGQITVASGETAVCTVFAEQTAPSEPPSCTLNANQQQISLGENVVLLWTSTNAVYTQIQPGIGEVDTGGQYIVTPLQTTTYTATFVGDSGEEVSCDVTVTVGESNPGCTSPEAINYDPTATEDDGSCEYEEGQNGMTRLYPTIALDGKVTADNIPDRVLARYEDYQGIYPNGNVFARWRGCDYAVQRPMGIPFQSLLSGAQTMEGGFLNGASVTNDGLYWTVLFADCGSGQGYYWSAERKNGQWYTEYKEPPVVEITGDDPLLVYADNIDLYEGVLATDPNDGDVTDSIVITNTTGLDLSDPQPGTYYVVYQAYNSAGIPSEEVSRIVVVVESEIHIDGLLPWLILQQAPGWRLLKPSCGGDIIDPTKPTVVLTHGLQDANNDPDDLWTNCSTEQQAGSILSRLIGDEVNIVTFIWEEANQVYLKAPDDREYIKARINVQNAGERLADDLLEALGDTYNKPIHFIGHSLGTAVNAYAAHSFLTQAEDVTYAQVTILDYPNHIEDKFGVAGIDEISRKEQQLYGFHEDFFLPLLTFDRNNLRLRIDNYYADQETNISFAGVGDEVIGAHNHRLVAPNDIDDIIKKEGLANDHSGVHQWYRWSMDPNSVGGDNYCSSLLNGTLVWDDLGFDSSLLPCQNGWYWALMNSSVDSLNEWYTSFPNPNLAGNTNTISEALENEKIVIEAGCKRYPNLTVCTEDSSPFIIYEVELAPDTQYISFDYKITGKGLNDYFSVLLDNLPVWSSNGDETSLGEWNNSGPISVGNINGPVTITFALHGEGEDDAEIMFKDLLAVRIEITDNIPPVTTVNFDGSRHILDQYYTSAYISLSAEDDANGVGVKSTEYSFDGENWLEYTGITTISEEGEYTIYYRSTDWFGNVEETKSVTFEIVSAQGLIEETFAWVEIQDDKKLKSLEQMLKNALDEKFWEDRNTLKKAGAQSVFSHLKNALKFIGETESDRTERLNLALEILNKTE